MAEKATQKNKNAAIAGRYWDSTKFSTMRTQGFNGQTPRLAEAQKMASFNRSLLSGNTPGDIKLPNGRA